MRFFAFLFLVLGLWALLVSFSMGLEGWKAKQWPEAKGRIIISKVQEWRTPGKIRIARLCLDVDYLYLVGERVLEGHRLNSGWRCFASEDHIKKILKRYPSGRQVRVYYNPENPEKSLLEPGISWSVLFLAGIGVINLSIAIPLIRSSRRGRRY
ncbi:MAG: hypothetical protein DSZ23_02540 [Thermodesulfatator sp.]|nr:MAG: hypothetical protein DSZ23_02540 [Thermodesulfatator sp.]